ncbi:hypothetical protein Lalb_Chr10g0097511 [Lupinus albus]|uniref:Uncharacterized protein n=1 Tax=Lupinus albus TaxID=3870 RepID=A0A6A4PW02_LUPAL|nr:hypothetical protein Lalb_Chr10g0097511 [Lupinus albus]
MVIGKLDIDGLKHSCQICFLEQLYYELLEIKSVRKREEKPTPTLLECPTLFVLWSTMRDTKFLKHYQ